MSRTVAQSSSTPDVYNAANAAHCIAVGNYLYGTPSASDWLTVQSTISNVLTEWKANNRDASVSVGVSNVSPSMVTSSSVNQSSLLSNMRLYQPKTQPSDIQGLLSLIDRNQHAVAGVLANLKATGMSPYLTQMMSEAGKIASNLKAGAAPSSSAQAFARISPDYRPAPPGPGYTCGADAVFCLGATIGMATLTVMTLGTAPILVGAAWAGIVLWGGIGASAWSVGHAIGCGVS